MAIWHFGNTTVRSPFRLREGLIALSQSSLQGNLRGVDQEKAFNRLLGDSGIVELRGDETYSVGRKWRAAMGKQGFIVPESPKGIDQAEIGALDTISPNGWRLIRAESVGAMQDCFLRSLAALAIEKDDGSVFSPLQHVIRILLELERQTGSSRISFIEIALFVQTSDDTFDIPTLVHEILAFRGNRESAERKKVFDREALEAAGKKFNRVAGTFRDYADLNIRYLKSTGLFQSLGRGIGILPEKHLLVEKLSAQQHDKSITQAYFKTLLNGAVLPTDSIDVGNEILNDILKQIQSKGHQFDMSNRSLETPADIDNVRYEAEEALNRINEESYAKQQAKQWREIADFMELLVERKGRKAIDDDNELVIPSGEAPAYFEWILWRAFLAINSLVNPPFLSRRFKIDQDFLPVGTAPGNGPDLIFEFDDFALIVEVTLTESSRQEAVEGEPVRRHVADLINAFNGKPVYGLFIANRIDSNTAETFRVGVWYTKDDEKLTLDIAPMTLSDFRKYFISLFEKGIAHPNELRALLDQCLPLRTELDAPRWKQNISELVLSRC